MRQRELGGFVVTAWTGVAAAPYAAPTLCTLLNINCRALSAEQELSVTQIAKLKVEFTKLVCDPKDMIIWAVDEVSFLAPEVLHHVDRRLRELTDQPNVPFGGIIIELIGDFWQKEPAGQISMAEELVRSDAPINSAGTPLDEGKPKAKGLSIFRNARRVKLLSQMRAADDPPFQEDQLALRRTDIPYPVPKTLVDSLTEISASDVREHPAFAFAPIGVLGNSERERLNFVQAEQFAKYHRRPLLPGVIL